MQIIFKKKCFLCKEWCPQKHKLRLPIGRVDCIANDSLRVKKKNIFGIKIYIVNGCKIS